MKVLIADDEVQIRAGLAEGIDWARLGVDTVLTAENGLDALEQCQKYRPEIVLTDIRMPGMTGLQLGKRVTELYAPVKVIILSGYSEFTYAQESLKIGAVEYLLKPLKIAELENTVLRCVAEIGRQKDEWRIQQAYTRQNQQLQLRQILKKGEAIGGAELEQLGDYAGMRADEPCFVALLCVDDAPEKQLPQIMSLIAAEATALEQSLCRVLFEDERSIVLLNSGFFRSKMESALLQWQKQVNGRLQASFRTGISIALSDTGTLRLTAVLYCHADLAMRHRICAGGASFLQWDDVKQHPGSDTQIPLPVQQMEACIRSGQRERMDDLLTQYFSAMRSSRVTSTEPLQAACLGIKELCLTCLRRQAPGQLPDSISWSESLPQYDTVDGYEAWSRRMAAQLFEHMGLFQERACSREIMQAVHYIAVHYKEKLALEDVAQQVGISKNYFSSLFKREMEISFVDYVTQVRIEEARRRLENTADMTYTIAADVGFSDYKYFSTVFKKVTGRTPSSYRK